MESSLADHGFRQIRIQQLDVETEKALKAEKYCLIFDKSGQAAVYFNYKATLVEFQKEILA